MPKLFSKYWRLDNAAKIRLDKVAKICTGRGMKYPRQENENIPGKGMKISQAKK